ncbi:MAG: lipoyl synthase [Gammaproteobacteria bacterium]|nr:lipoyl synthase [Gammaproteobacteria bacterium]
MTAKTDYIVTSGAKVTNAQGIHLIKDGIKHNPKALPNREQKPEWLRIRVGNNDTYQKVKDIVNDNQLSTVCQEAKCPNIHECWQAGTATLILMGSICTRACRFCAVDTGNPRGYLDIEEPQRSAKAVQLMRLRYVVLTSVDRDDLEDGGASHYAACIKAIKELMPQTAVEALTPDFGGSTVALETLLATDVAVFAQNIETVERLTHPVRDPRAGYVQTLNLLADAKAYSKEQQRAFLVKTSLMLGLGERDDEIIATMNDLRQAGVDVLTLGQYLRPTANHLAVERYVTPEQFECYRQWGLERGFLEVVAGSLVRSSYRAEKVLEKHGLLDEEQGSRF